MISNTLAPDARRKSVLTATVSCIQAFQAMHAMVMVLAIPSQESVHAQIHSFQAIKRVAN